jgi:hypothetical protein
MTITIRPRWSQGRGNTVVPSRWQATPGRRAWSLHLARPHDHQGGKQPGNGKRDRGCQTRNRPREAVMGVVEVDPLAVLPVTAASASAAFARATDPHRDRNERQEQLQALRLMLASVRRHLDRCDQAAVQLAEELDRPRCEQACSAGWAVCRLCLGVPLTCSAGTGHCTRCKRTIPLDRGRSDCGERTAVVLRNATGTEQCVCLSHAAGAIRHTAHIEVVTASRLDRTVLADIARESSVIRRPRSPLAEAEAGPDGG